MKILIACEYSGIIRDAFKDKGWNATSCDILKSDKPGQHITGDIFNSDINFSEYDLLIGHPPCQYLSKAGLHYEKNNPDRIIKRNEAIQFFLQLYNLPIKHIAIENPVGYINKHILKHSQIIQPFYWGDKNKKETCLWLKNLPYLIWSDTDNLFDKKTSCNPPEPAHIWTNKNGKVKKEYFTYNKNAHKRSKTFKVIALAMAEQWTDYFKNN